MAGITGLHFTWPHIGIVLAAPHLLRLRWQSCHLSAVCPVCPSVTALSEISPL
jgi:hypothetical protein